MGVADDVALRIFVWAERAWLVTMAILAATGHVSHDTSTLPILLVLSSVGGLALSVVLLLVPTRRPHTLRRVESTALAVIVLGIMGDQFGLYVHVPYYDKILHVIVPLALTYALFKLSQATKWVWSWTKVKPFEVGLYVFSIALALGAIWEIYEFVSDLWFGTQQQGGPHGANFDTMTDLIADTLGALIGALIAGFTTAYGRKHGLGTISEGRKHLMRRLGERAFAKRLEDEHPAAKRHR